MIISTVHDSHITWHTCDETVILGFCCSVVKDTKRQSADWLHVLGTCWEGCILEGKAFLTNVNIMATKLDNRSTIIVINREWKYNGPLRGVDSTC